MGRLPHSEKQVKKKKLEILDKALKIIKKDGYDGFSIRKLGPKLGVAPKTIYNYFHNKDEIYLHILIRGFEILYDDLEQDTLHIKDPFEKLTSLVQGYITFGFEKPNYYDIMLTLYVPKANDYVDTPLEDLAAKELETALSTADLFVKTIREINIDRGIKNDDETQIHFIQLLTGMHGIVALKNNTILDYIHEDPKSIIDRLTQEILKPFEPH